MKLGRTRTIIPTNRRPMKRRQNDLERGQVMIMVGLAAVIMFAFVGIAVDVGRLYVTKAELSRAVDAAALSGILELDGTSAGETAAENKARSYFEENEGGSDADVDPQAISGENEMTVDATKSVKMYFLSVIGIQEVTVKAHARAGFGTQYLDVVMSLDATPSMAGAPLTNAKAAAINFKNILLGDNPAGNVLVGMTPFRGCFQPPITSTNCINTSTQVQGLTSNSTTLNTKINAITAGGSTNVCTGLAQAWNIFSGTVAGSAAHFDDDLYPNNRQYLVLLSDGDNYYTGDSTYQGPQYYSSGALDPASSPTGTTVGGNVYPCQPIDPTSGSVGDNCPSPWNSPAISSTYPCYKGVNGSSSSIVSDNWDSNSWTGGSGWATSWTPNTTNTTVVTTASGTAQSGSYQLRLGRGSGVATDHATDGFESNNWTGGTGWSGNWIPSSANSAVLSTPTGSPQEGSRQLRMGRTSTTNTVASDGFDTNTWNGGSGWAGDWQRNNTNAIVTSLQTTSPQAGARNLRLGRNGSGTTNVGSVWRAVNLTSVTNAQLTYYTRRNGFSGTDRVFLEWSTSANGTYTVLATHGESGQSGVTHATNTTYGSAHVINLNALTGQTVYLRFRSTMSADSDQFFIDTINLTTAVAENASIYRSVSLNGLANASLTYYTKRNSGFSGAADRVYVEAATSLGGTWTLLATHASTTGTGLTQTGTSWAATPAVSLNSFAGQSTVYIRFRSTMDDDADQFFIDNIALTTASTVSGSIYRSFSLSGQDNASLTYYAKRSNNFLSSDRVYVEAATSTAGTWTLLQTLAGTTGVGLTNVGTGWGAQTVSLDSFAGQGTVYVRFRGEMDNDSDQFFIDTLSITTFTDSPANGYLNGNDSSNPANCDTEQKPRERQLDVRTIKLAEAIKAQGIEIYVVAFAGDGSTQYCWLNQNVAYDASDVDDCGTVDVNSSYPIGKSGKDGYTNAATANPNVRLLQCIASSTPGSKDHYYYASSSSELTSIFTKIANQISLRLIE